MELYHSKKFGELLGYGKCAMNLQKNGSGEYSIQFYINKQIGKRSIFENGPFGLGCNLKSIDTKYYFDLFVKMNKLLERSKYYITLLYMDKSALL